MGDALSIYVLAVPNPQNQYVLIQNDEDHTIVAHSILAETCKLTFEGGVLSRLLGEVFLELV